MQDLREIKWRCLSCMSWHLLSFLLRFVLLSYKRSSSFVFYFLCFIDIWWPREDSLGGSITNSIEFGDGNSLCTSDPSLPHSWWDCKNIYPLLTLLSIITALNHVKEMSHKFSMSLFWRIFGEYLLFGFHLPDLFIVVVSVFESHAILSLSLSSSYLHSRA